jgi:hypothetical protein
MKTPKQKHHKISLLLILLFTFVSFSSNAQDIIYKRTNEKIEAKVLEIGMDEIKFIPYDNPDGPIISIDKDDVAKIKFEKGSDWINWPDPYSINQNPEILNKNRAIKFNLFSPLFGFLGFGYEQMLKPGVNIDATVGIIGPSISNNIDERNPGGVFIKVGPKFKIGSEYRQRGVRYSHHLAGKYLMPQISFSSFKVDGTYSVYNPSTGLYTYEDQRYSVNSFAFNLAYGKQSIVGGIMVVDWNIGAGFGLQSTDKKTDSSYGDQDNYEVYCFSHLYAGPGFPMTFNATIAIGFLTK